VKPTLARNTRLLALLALVAAGPVLVAGSRPAHLELLKSSPANGATVASVSEIRLWFSAAPMAMGPSTTTIRVLGADGKAVASGNGVKDAKDPKVYSLTLPRGLEPRAYKVAWQTMADDGDVVKGEFGFTVAAN
jgi:copper resistance protein C